MPRPDFPGNILEFQRRFADEAVCLEYLAASRWPDGYRCPACGGARAWVLARRHLWQCVACGHQASVTAGTVLHGTRTPLPLWFWAAYLVSTLTPGIPAAAARGPPAPPDGWAGYADLAGRGYEHRPRSQRANPDEQLLPRIHRAISNLKSWLRGPHRGVSGAHLQVYLDEYVFRFNRRGPPMAAFQTLLGLGSQHEPTTYHQILARPSEPDKQ